MPNTLEAQYRGELRAIAIGDAARRLNELRERGPPPGHVERVPEVVRAFPDRECRYYAIGVSRRGIARTYLRVIERNPDAVRAALEHYAAGGHPLTYLFPLA